MNIVNKLYIFTLLFTLTSIISPVASQSKRITLSKANNRYKEGAYVEAEKLYRQSVGSARDTKIAYFGLANTLYKQKKHTQASEIYQQLASDTTLAPQQRSQIYHNLGNISMANKKYEEAIEVYKKALILNPQDDDTRYNLVLAQKQIKKDNNQTQNDKNQEQNQDKNQQNKQDKNKDQNKDPNKNDKDKNKDKSNQQDQAQDNSNKGTPPPQRGIDKQQAEQLLDAYKASDEETRKRVEKQQREKREQRDNNNKRQW